jgi:hypothetical protein
VAGNVNLVNLVGNYQTYLCFECANEFEAACLGQDVINDISSLNAEEKFWETSPPESVEVIKKNFLRQNECRAVAHEMSKAFVEGGK